MITVGTKAPNFCLPNQDDTSICLQDLQGKWVVLYFYPKDNTPGCTREALDFSQESEFLSKTGAIVLGVSADSTASHKKFIEKQNLKISLLSDTEKSVLKAYGVWQKKKLFSKEYYGIVRTTFLIDKNQIVRKIWDKVRVKDHAKSAKDAFLELISNG